MTVEEILNGESKEVEYKEMIPANSKKYTKTAVAYANCAGGLLIFGVEDNTWKVTGIPQEKVFEVSDAISNAIMDSCEPMIDFDIKYQTIEEKTIIIVQVYPGKHRPYFLKSEGKPNGVYIRVSGSTRVADDYIVKELEFQGAKRSYDQIIAVGETVTEEEIEELCNKMYQYALNKCRSKQEEESVKKISKKNLLSWGLLQIQEGKVVPTNGYMLLANNDNSDITIQCGVFKGTTRAVFLDRKEYDGPIYKQVALYDDRLEITSPGMLIGGLSIEDLKAGCCQARNRGIVSAFTYMKIIEQWGSGIPRLMENCKSAGLREPELLEIGGSFRVNMFRNTEILSETTQTIQTTQDTTQATQTIQDTIQDELLSDLDKEVLRLLLKKPEITQKEMALELGWKVERVKYYTNKLKKQNVIERVGSSQKGCWKVRK